jgi:hypothetical protein
MASLPELFQYVQQSLFPRLDSTMDTPLTEEHEEIIWILSVLRVEKVVADPWRWHRVGVLELDRRKLARAFVVKAWLGLEQTEDLRKRLKVDRTLRTLCGWQGSDKFPSSSTFSRAFAVFAHSGILDRLHALRVEEALADGVTLHICRDSTAVVARERQAPKAPASPRVKRKRGRPRKSEGLPRLEVPERRMVRQLTQSAAEALEELPRHCGMGAKRHGCGIVTAWRGYKLHLDVTDEGIPVTAITTSAEVNDNQVAIPLMRLSSARVRYCYELMDCGYQGAEIPQAATELGHVAIVAPRGYPKKSKVSLEPDRARHFRARTAAERCYSQFKDTAGTRQIWVRGYAKVHASLMFAVLVVFAKMLLTLLR